MCAGTFLHHLRAKEKLPEGSLSFAVEMVEIESTSENDRSHESTVRSIPFDLNTYRKR